LNLGYVPWDAPECVEENRRRFLTALNLEAESLATLSQVHSDRAHILEENPVQWNRHTQGDALITGRPGAALGIQVADCFPVLMVDRLTQTVAAIHAGWRGTLARIASKTVERMVASFGCNRASLLVAIGPGIRSCCFEVGSEVSEAFEKEFPGAKLARAVSQGKYHVDLCQALGIQLAEAGVDSNQVYDLEACTHCQQDQFFSYRREGLASGRMLAVIARS
jgi:YfiH family protein